MRKHVTLITGASGEIGHGLIERLTADGSTSIITIDLQPLAPELASKVEQEYQVVLLMVSEEMVYQIQLQVQQPFMLEAEEEMVMMLLTDKEVKVAVEPV